MSEGNVLCDSEETQFIPGMRQNRYISERREHNLSKYNLKPMSTILKQLIPTQPKGKDNNYFWE